MNVILLSDFLQVLSVIASLLMRGAFALESLETWIKSGARP